MGTEQAELLICLFELQVTAYIYIRLDIYKACLCVHYMLLMSINNINLCIF